MFDAKIRPLINPALNKGGATLASYGLTANALTLCGLAVCLPLFLALFTQNYSMALFLMCLNRFVDGLDGPLARHSKSGPSDFGGYIDILSDFIFYSGFVFFFAAGAQEFMLSAAFLLFSFFASGTSFMGYALLAAKRNMHTEKQGKKSFYYMAGLAEGGETIFAFILICLFPAAFHIIAVLFGLMCWVTAIGRVAQAYHNFKD